MWLPHQRLLFGFVGAFAAVAIVFLGAAAGTLVALRDIKTAAQDLLGNALPSVTELMRAREAQDRLDDNVATVGKTPQAARIELFAELDVALADLHTALATAMATPDYPGERELYTRQAQPSLAHLDAAMDEFRAAIESDPGDERRIVTAAAKLDGAAREVDGALEALTQMNHAKAYEAASRIVRTHAHAFRLGLYMEVASSLVAFAAAFIAVRAGLRFGREAMRHLRFETERASELDAFAQRVAHDLLTPLGAVSLSLGSLKKAHPDPGTVRIVDRAVRALERSRGMVQGIYTFARSGARPEPGGTAPLRATALEAADELIANETQPGATIDMQGLEDVEVAMDRAALGVVLSNLLSNAAKFSSESAGCRITVRSNGGGECVHVEIEDTGPGVPPGLEQAIFEPYRRAPGVTQPGLGLGLATAKRLVLAHRGKMGVRRAPSGGSISWFDLPRAPGPHAERAAEQPSYTTDREPHAVH